MSETFDRSHPPDRALIDKCVHCGFCLPTCPTYVLWGEEMDSPRGRIYLMEAGLDERATMAPGFVRHFDACLGCMACVTACPSGVQYSPLIEATRGQIDRRFSRPLADRLFRAAIFSLFPYPARLRFALAPLVVAGWARDVARALRRIGRSSGDQRSRSDTRRSGSGRAAELAVQFKSLTFERKRRARREQRDSGPPDSGLLARLRAMIELAPHVTVKSLLAQVPARTPANGARRLTVGLLTGCVQRIAFPRVNEASVRVLAAEGCDVVAPPEQGCCGALALHAGRLDEARAFARRTIDVFERAGVEAVAVNAAGCGSSMKEYGQLLADDAAWAERARAFSEKVRDVSQILCELGPRAERHALQLRVAYHDACHLAHAQGVRQPPRDVLRSIPGLEIVPLAEQEICCGSAGIYNLVEPVTGRELGDRKAGVIDAARPDIVATANPGCTLQIAAAAARRGRAWTIRHPIELLDASIRGSNP